MVYNKAIQEMKNLLTYKNTLFFGGCLMDFTGFYHETKSSYAYVVDIHTLYIRIRTRHEAASKIKLTVFDPPPLGPALRRRTF